MMMAKVLCVHLVSMLGYNMLYQDVDMVWFHHPLDYLQHETSADMVFQYDHNTELRFAPFAANTGFYYVRANPRTQYFLGALVSQMDLVASTASHTAALTALLQTHNTHYGLTVRVLEKETKLFPSGYHWNEEPGYMKEMWGSHVDPYLFHMSRTENKKVSQFPPILDMYFHKWAD